MCVICGSASDLKLVWLNASEGDMSTFFFTVGKQSPWFLAFVYMSMFELHSCSESRPCQFNFKYQRTVGLVSLNFCWGYVKISGYWGKRSLKILNLSDLEQVQWMSLTFGIHIQSCMYSFSFLHLPIFISQTTIILKNTLFYLFPIQNSNKSIRNQSWSCRKMCHVKVTPGSSFEQTL